MRSLLYVTCFLVLNCQCQAIERETWQENEVVKEVNREKSELVKTETHSDNRVMREMLVMGRLYSEDSGEANEIMQRERERKNKLLREEPAEGKVKKKTTTMKKKMVKDGGRAPSLPNIVVLLADDLGYGDLSFSGHPTSRTPEIDRLARESLFFTHHYVTSPMCSPSRASLLTGRIQVRSGVYPGVFVPENFLGLPRNETTIAALLKSKGYSTMITGKWHLGVGREGEYLPTHYGFDHYLGLPYSHDMCPCLICFPGPLPCYDTCMLDRVSCPLYSNTTIVEQPADFLSLTSRLVDAAVTFITRAAASNTPFFLYFPFFHIHHPQFASETFAGTSRRGTVGDSLNELDWAVGQVVAALQDHDLLSSTLIWFSSDNGPSLRRHERGGCAGLLRCGKGTTWEGGVRLPMFVHWPSQISAGRSDGLVSALDLLPTVASVVGLNTSGLTLDGVDITPLLRDPLAPSPRQYMAIYPESPSPEVGPLAVTNGTYKAHFYTKGSDLSDASNYDPMCPGSHPLTSHDPPLLFDIYRDPGERYDLSADPQYSDVLSDLTAWRNDHMQKMTWDIPRTVPTDLQAQPCCTSPSCTPFPQCCDCPSSALTTTPVPTSPQPQPNPLPRQ